MKEKNKEYDNVKLQKSRKCKCKRLILVTIEGWREGGRELIAQQVGETKESADEWNYYEAT